MTYPRTRQNLKFTSIAIFLPFTFLSYRRETSLLFSPTTTKKIWTSGRIRKKKNVKKLKNAAQIIKEMFDKQLPQIKPQILSSIKNDLHEIMKIVEEIENQLELIELNRKLQITLFNKQKLITTHEAIKNFNKINQTINAATKELQLLTTITPQGIKRRKPKYCWPKHNATHENLFITNNNIAIDR